MVEDSNLISPVRSRSGPAPFVAPDKAVLAASGRVVDPAGNPVADAEVRLDYRVSFEALFAQRSGRGGFGFGGRGGRGGQGGRGGGDRNGGRGGRWSESFRDQLRPQPLAEPVRTRADGTFSLKGEAFESSSLTVLVRHELFAPALRLQRR